MCVLSIKNAHTKKSLETYRMPLVYGIFMKQTNKQNLTLEDFDIAEKKIT